MYVRELSLVDFRSWASLDVALGPGPVVLVGPNGAGKTNIVEAIGYLATLGSHRVATDAPLIRRDAARALIRAAVVSDDRELTVEVELVSGKANRARVNRAPRRRARDVLGIARTVLFAPEDLALVRGDPSDRRRFLDELLVMRAPRLAGVKADYEKILKQRSTLLKSAGGARRAGGSLTTLEVWNEHLARAGGELMAARLSLVDELQPHLATAYATVAPDSAAAGLWYRSTVRDVAGERVRDAATLTEALRGEMVRLREAELDRGVCLVGPHRDDLDLLLADGPAKGYASHGESWSFALALRLASWALLRTDGIEPILILDDVFAELDLSRRARLAAMVADAEQTIITAAVPADVPADLAGRVLSLDSGHIEEVTE